MTDKSIDLILGGARSGKSSLAEQRAQASGKQCIYLATATADDEEMAERIRHHKDRRRGEWKLVEEPIHLSQALLKSQQKNRCILVDCLTLWLSNCLHQDCWPREKKALMDTLGDLEGQIIFVSNEVGAGIVPMGDLSRRFVDESGLLHQQLAETCQRVSLVVAGLTLELKPNL